MTLYKRNKILFIVFIALLFFSPRLCNAADTEESAEEILFITSYNSDTKYTYDNISTFIQTYTQLGGKYSTIVENMNVTDLSQAHKWKETLTEILDKHPGAKLVIFLGGEAWSSFLHLEDEKYKRLPVFFAMASRNGIRIPDEPIDMQQYEPQSIDLTERMKEYNVKYCSSYEYDINKDIEMMKYFYPEMEHLAFVSDNTYNGLAEQAWFKKNLKNHPELSITYIDGRIHTLDMAVNQLRVLPKNSVMLLGIWRIDNRGITYMNNSVYAFSKANPLLPVFSLTSTAIGYWAIGGYVPQYEGIAKGMGEYAYQFLDKGKNDIRSINILPNKYKFDANKLKEWGFEDKKLPINSIVINQPIPFFVAYKTEVQFILLTFLVLIGGLMIALYYYYRTKILKNRLERTTKQLREDKKKLEASEIELRDAKERAEEANQLKSAFVSNMSHEIRTPLNAIVGFSSLLVEPSTDAKEREEYSSIIRNNTDLMLNLVNDVLDLSRMETGDLHFDIKDHLLLVCCQMALESVRHRIPDGVKLTFSPAGEPIVVHVDNLRLQQLLTNLLTNAAKFTEKGEINLSFQLEPDRKKVCIAVTDTGAGIPLEKQATIFNRFEKLDDYKPGVGLGLSICLLIAERLDGALFIDSSYTDGARFVLILSCEIDSSIYNPPIEV